jgi:hypothetical protein
MVGSDREDHLRRRRERRAHLVENEAAELVRLELDFRSAAAGGDGVTGEVMGDLVRHHAHGPHSLPPTCLARERMKSGLKAITRRGTPSWSSSMTAAAFGTGPDATTKLAGNPV